MAKKSADKTEYIALKKAISAGDIKNLYMFWGKEDYLRDYYFEQMKKKLLPQGLEEFNHRRFEGKNIDLDAISEAVDACPAFSERTLVEIRNFDIFKCAEDKREKIIEIIENLPEYCCMVFIYTDPEFKPDARTKIYNAFKKYGSAVEFPEQEQSDIINWLKRRFKSHDKEIDSKNAEYMVFLCGGLMTNLISEVDKISAYAEGRVITKKEIDAVATPVLDAVVFRMTDAISEKKFDTAAKIMSELLQMKEAPIMMTAMVGRQMRQLLAAKIVYNNGGDERQLKNVLSIKSDYAARLVLSSSRNFSIKWCTDAVRLCGETDLKMKSSGEDPQQLLKMLLLQLASAER